MHDAESKAVVARCVLPSDAVRSIRGPLLRCLTLCLIFRRLLFFLRAFLRSPAECSGANSFVACFIACFFIFRFLFLRNVCRARIVYNRVGGRAAGEEAQVRHVTLMASNLLCLLLDTISMCMYPSGISFEMFSGL